MTKLSEQGRGTFAMFGVGLFAFLVLVEGWAGTFEWKDGRYETRGEVFAIDSGEKLFTYEKILLKKNNNIETTARYRTLDEKDAFVQKAKVENGKLVTYSFQGHQNQASGQVDVAYPADRNPRATFQLETSGKAKLDEDRVSDLPTSPGNLIETIFFHWADLMSNQTVDISMLVIDELEAFSFKVRRDLPPRDGEETLVIKPTNFIISAIVDPIKIHIRTKPDFQVVEVQGRLPVKRKVGEKFVPFIGRLVLKPAKFAAS